MNGIVKVYLCVRVSVVERPLVVECWKRWGVWCVCVCVCVCIEMAPGCKLHSYVRRSQHNLSGGKSEHRAPHSTISRAYGKRFIAEQNANGSENEKQWGKSNWWKHDYYVVVCHITFKIPKTRNVVPWWFFVLVPFPAPPMASRE